LPPRRDGRDLARRLLRRADADATLVRHVVDEADIADAIVGFHAQQAAEKSIKAVLAAREIEYGKTHSSTT
jgi:HEPN domain-containing protein